MANGLRLLLVLSLFVSGTLSSRAAVEADPNPIVGDRGTILTLTVPPGGALIQIDVFDIEGRLVQSLVPIDGSGVATFHPGGVSDVGWNGKNGAGQYVVPGVYFAILRVNGRIVDVVKLVKVN